MPKKKIVTAPLDAATQVKIDKALKDWSIHFPQQVDDISLMILKAHLLAENLLREFINSKLAHPSAIKESRLTYSQLHDLARALSPKPEYDSWIWDGSNRLNVLRNKIAHKLIVGEDGNSKLDEFIKIATINLQDDRAKPLKQRLLKDFDREKQLRHLLGWLYVEMVILFNL